MNFQEANGIRQYLLGELPESERPALEERFFADDEFFDQLLDAENDLLDAYVRGELSRGQQERMAAKLEREPGAQRELALASALARAASRTARVRRSFSGWLWTLAATAAALAIWGGWLATANREMSQRLLAFERRPAPAPPGVFAVSIPAGQQRGSGPSASPPIVVPPSAEFVSLSLQLAPGEPYRDYSMILRTARGEEVARFAGLSPTTLAGSTAVEVYLQASLLPAGEYEVALAGETAGRTEPVGFAYFQVTR